MSSWIPGLAACMLFTAYGWWWGTRDERERASRWRVVIYGRVTDVLENSHHFDLALTQEQRRVIAQVIDEAAAKFDEQGPRLSRIGGNVSRRTRPLATRP